MYIPKDRRIVSITRRKTDGYYLVKTQEGRALNIYVDHAFDACPERLKEILDKYLPSVVDMMRRKGWKKARAWLPGLTVVWAGGMMANRSRADAFCSDSPLSPYYRQYRPV
jgi:hypothetical protein